MVTDYLVLSVRQMLCFGMSNDLLDNAVLQRFRCQRGSNENLSWHVCRSTDKAVVSAAVSLFFTSTSIIYRYG